MSWKIYMMIICLVLQCVINRTSIVKCECIYDFYSDVASNPWQQEHRDTILSH